MTDIALPVRLTAHLPQAWRHHCGYLNDGGYKAGDVCSGCRSDARPEDVDARYLLVEVED